MDRFRWPSGLLLLHGEIHSVRQWRTRFPHSPTYRSLMLSTRIDVCSGMRRRKGTDEPSLRVAARWTGAPQVEGKPTPKSPDWCSTFMSVESLQNDPDNVLRLHPCRTRWMKSIRSVRRVSGNGRTGRCWIPDEVIPLWRERERATTEERARTREQPILFDAVGSKFVIETRPADSEQLGCFQTISCCLLQGINDPRALRLDHRPARRGS